MKYEKCTYSWKKNCHFPLGIAAFISSTGARHDVKNTRWLMSVLVKSSGQVSNKGSKYMVQYKVDKTKKKKKKRKKNSIASPTNEHQDSKEK
jgi:hypothetical protein